MHIFCTQFFLQQGLIHVMKNNSVGPYHKLKFLEIQNSVILKCQNVVQDIYSLD